MEDKKLTIIFAIEKETKNTFRFVEREDAPAVGTLYIQKHALKKLGNPQALRVTIEPFK